MRELEFDAAALSRLNNGEDEALFKTINYIQLVWKYRWWLCVGAACGVTLGVLMYVRSGPEYEATAQVLVSRKDSVPIREEQRTLSDFGERSEHIALIQSPLIIKRAIELGQLQKLPMFVGDPEVDIEEDIIDDLRVKRSSGQDRSYLNVLTLTFPARTREEAGAVVEAVIAAYDEYLQKTRSEKSEQILKVTQDALKEVEGKLHDKEQEYHAFREVAPMQWKAPVGAGGADGQKTTNVHQERIFAAEEQRRLNLLRKALLDSRLKTIQAGIERGDSRESLEVLIRRFLSQDGAAGDDFQQRQQQDISIFDNRLMPMLLEEKQLLRDFGPDHPDVKLIRESITTALDFYRRQGLRLPEERRLKQADGSSPIDEIDFVALYANLLTQELRELEIRDGELATLVDVESVQAKNVARFQARDESLSAELARLRDLWGQLVTQVNQVGIESDGSGYVLKQLAAPKEELSIKKIIKMVGGGGIFGMVLVAALCVLRELRDLRINTIAELRRASGHSLLGTIGHFAKSLDPGVKPNNLHPALRYLLAPRSIEAENYRALRTALCVTGDDANAKLILVTSPESGDGKSTTIANLAVAMAQSGKRVLLIDADLRRPTLQNLFRVPPEVGLVDVLLGEVEGLNAIRPTFIEQLSLLPAGQPPENPAELIASPRLDQLFRQVRDEFDVVLIDSPPLLAVSDPCAVGRQTDGILLVVRLGKTSLVTMRRAGDVLTTHALPVLGMVANDTGSTDVNAYSGDEYYRDASVPATTRDVAELAPR